MDKFENLDDVFNVTSDIMVPEKTERPVLKKSEEENSDQVTDDHEYARATLYQLVEKGQEAINGILDVAMTSDHPRAYEVAGQLIKSVGDVADKLMALQKATKDVKQESKKGPNNVTNALFVGSTAELQKLLKKGTLEDK
jgi:hypothetical protein